jgi:hypothetical protein
MWQDAQASFRLNLLVKQQQLAAANLTQRCRQKRGRPAPREQNRDPEERS